MGTTNRIRRPISEEFAHPIGSFSRRYWRNKTMFHVLHFLVYIDANYIDRIVICNIDNSQQLFPELL